MWLLDGLREALELIDRVVLALEREFAVGKEAFDDLDRLFEAVDASPGRGVRDACPFVIPDQPAGAQAEVQAPVRKEVERRSLLGQDDRVSVVVVEDKRPDAQGGGRVGDRHQRGDRARLAVEVIGQIQRLVTHRLDGASPRPPLAGALGVMLLNGEGECPLLRHPWSVGFCTDVRARAYPGGRAGPSAGASAAKAVGSATTIGGGTTTGAGTIAGGAASGTCCCGCAGGNVCCAAAASCWL